MALSTGSLNATDNASKTGQGKCLLKNGECSRLRGSVDEQLWFSSSVDGLMLAWEFLWIQEEFASYNNPQGSAGMERMMRTQ
jgi:hypothetical protein